MDNEFQYFIFIHREVIYYGYPRHVLMEVNCLKYLETQVMADGRCEHGVHRINEGYKAYGSLKCVVSNIENHV